MQVLPKTKVQWLRTLIPLALIGLAAGAWCTWKPGARVTDGRHDLGTNGVWMAHGWLASDQWFMQNPERMAQLTLYHNTPSVIATLQEMKNRGMADLFLDLHPCSADGALPATSYSSAETLGLLAAGLHLRAWPWVGGERGQTCFPEQPEWRRTFVASCKDLLTKCPHLAGVMINIEPWPENDPHMLILLDELRQALPKGKQVAVNACPPPTMFQPDPSHHWGEAYFKKVAAQSDLLVVKLSETGLTHDRLFTRLIAAWTREALQWAGTTPVLIGLADYEEETPQPWHHAEIETLSRALSGVHAGLMSFDRLPTNYRGVALFADYTMNAEKWAVWETEFCAKRAKIAVQKPPTLEELMRGMAQQDPTQGNAQNKAPNRPQAKPQPAPPPAPSQPQPPPLLKRPAENGQ